MSKRIYVGNLPFNATDSDLRGLFEEFGSVVSVDLAVDREGGRPRGFGFVEMEDEGAADGAIVGLSGTSFNGRTLNVSEARARSADRRPRGGAKDRW